MVRNQQESTPNGDYTQATTKHSRLYFDDGSLILKATAVLFRIHWGILRAHSSFFYETFIVPCFSAGRGNTESTPLVLQDIASSDLESFLSFFYPSTIGETDLPMSVEQWTSVLVLASQWHFSSLRDYAIYRLEKITTPAQRISLAKTQHIPKWLVPAYIELCSQKAPLDRSDARLLGLDDVLAIWEVQHELARGPLYEDGEVRQLVEAKITGLGEKGESTSPALTLVNGFGEHAGTGSTGIARMPPSDTFVHVVGPASSNHGLPVDVLAPTPSAFNLPLTEISPHPHGEHEAAPSVPDKPSAVFLSTAPTTHVNAETTISLSLSTPQALPSTLPSTPDSPPRAPLSPDHVRQPPHAFSRTQSPDSLGPSPSSTPTTMFSMTPLGLVPRRVAGPERQQGRANGQGNNNKPSQTLASATERRAPGAAAVKQAALSAKKRKKAAGAKGTSTGLAA